MHERMPLKRVMLADQFPTQGAEVRGFTHTVVYVLEHTATLGFWHTGASAEHESRITRAALDTGLAAVLGGEAVQTCGRAGSHTRLVVAVGSRAGGS